MKHGAAKGGKRTPEYRTWLKIIERCCHSTSKDYPKYGGRGIMIIPEWRDNFGAFLAALGTRPAPGLTIDRINNSLGYEPGNVRWASKREQARNRRDNIFLLIEGKPVLLVEACERFGISRSVVRNRLADGWNDERAVKTPVRMKRTASLTARRSLRDGDDN